MSKRYLVVALALVISVVAAPPSDAREFADIYVECGLGALIAPNTPVVAVITNITWDLGTTAISSNVSSPESCKGGRADTAFFINDSYDELEADLASGGGEYLAILAVLVQDEIVDQDGFLRQLRADFASYVAQPEFETASHFEKAEALYDMVYRQASS